MNLPSTHPQVLEQRLGCRALLFGVHREMRGKRQDVLRFELSESALRAARVGSHFVERCAEGMKEGHACLPNSAHRLGSILWDATFLVLVAALLRG